jgi:hypothetical protein
MVPQEAQAPRSIMETVHEAVMRGLPIDVINNLVALHKEFAADAAKREFDEAFAKAKAEIKVVDKDAHVGFPSKDASASRTDYDHDTLAGIYEAAVPALSKYGLSYKFKIKQDMLPGSREGEFSQLITVTCIISGLGHSEETVIQGPPDFEGKKTGLKAIASAITMMQRYALRSALGLASRKDKSDDDGAAAEAAARSSQEVEDGPISDAQVQELINLADEVGADKRRFCLHFKIGGFAEIRQSQFARAKQEIERKRKVTADA